MLVRLRKDKDLALHKVPVDTAWQNREVGDEEALSWVYEGGGIGIDISRSELIVLDIDEASPDAANIARWFGERGAVVCVTPSGGYHVFVRRPEGIRVQDGKYRLEAAGLKVVCDVFAGGSAHYVVLPVVGTPRAELGGVVWWAEGKEDWEARRLEDFLELFRDYVVLLPFVQGWQLLPLKRADQQRIKKETRRRWHELLGKSWLEATPEDICRVMREAPAGTRHTTMLSLSVIWHLRKMGDWAPFVEACRAAWSDEPRAVEREVLPAIASLEQGRPYRRRQDVPVFVAISDGDGVEYIPSRNGHGDKNGHDKVDTIERFVETVFSGSVAWCKWRERVYVLYEGWALDEVALRAFSAAQGVSLGDERAKIVLAYIQRNFPQKQDAIIAESYVQLTRMGLLVAAEKEGKTGVLIATASGLEFFEVGMVEGVYVKYQGEVRMVTKFWGDIPRWREELVLLLKTFFAGEPENERSAYVAAVLAAGTALAQGILFVLGKSGSGKSTLSKVLQYMINGREVSVNPSDNRDLIAVMANARTIGIEEVSSIDVKATELLNQATTGGSMAFRMLYTPMELGHLETATSVIIATTDLEDVAGDMMRRALCVYPTPNLNRKVADDDLRTALKYAEAAYMLGYMDLCKGYRMRGVDVTPYELFCRETTADLPIWLRGATKADIARAYWYLCRELGVAEDVAQRVWRKVRNANMAEKLGVWHDVILRVEEDVEFAEMMKRGATAGDIVSKLTDTGEPNRALETRLGRTWTKVSALLSEMGYRVSKEQRKDSNRRTRPYFILEKIEVEIEQKKSKAESIELSLDELFEMVDWYILEKRIPRKDAEYVRFVGSLIVRKMNYEAAKEQMDALKLPLEKAFYEQLQIDLRNYYRNEYVSRHVRRRTD